MTLAELIPTPKWNTVTIVLMMRPLPTISEKTQLAQHDTQYLRPKMNTSRSLTRDTPTTGTPTSDVTPWNLRCCCYKPDRPRRTMTLTELTPTLKWNVVTVVLMARPLAVIFESLKARLLHDVHMTNNLETMLL